MKVNLFEILLNLLTNLKIKHQLLATKEESDLVSEQNNPQGPILEVVKAMNEKVIRVFTPEEQWKLTKASYQFLMQFQAASMVHPDAMELIVNRLMFSNSRYVSLQETKWTIRNTLSETLNADQLAFLDLVLYQKEDELSLH